MNIYIDDATVDYNGKRNPTQLLKVLTEFRHILGGANLIMAVHSLKSIPPSILNYFTDYIIFSGQPHRYIQDLYENDLSSILQNLKHTQTGISEKDFIKKYYDLDNIHDYINISKFNLHDKNNIGNDFLINDFTIKNII